MNGESPGETIRRARHEARLTQARLAEELGVHKNTVADWEKDKYFPDRHWGALDEILHISLGPPGTRTEPEQPKIPDSLLREIMSTDGLTPEERQAVIDAIERTLRGEDVSPAVRPEQRRRPASLSAGSYRGHASRAAVPASTERR